MQQLLRVNLAAGSLSHDFILAINYVKYFLGHLTRSFVNSTDRTKLNFSTHPIAGGRQLIYLPLPIPLPFIPLPSFNIRPACPNRIHAIETGEDKRRETKNAKERRVFICPQRSTNRVRKNQLPSLIPLRLWIRRAFYDGVYLSRIYAVEKEPLIGD